MTGILTLVNCSYTICVCLLELLIIDHDLFILTVLLLILSFKVLTYSSVSHHFSTKYFVEATTGFGKIVNLI